MLSLAKFLRPARGLLADGPSGHALTADGRAVMGAAVPAHLANADRLLSALPAADRSALADLLRRLLVEFEGSRPAGGAPGRRGGPRTRTGGCAAHPDPRRRPG